MSKRKVMARLDEIEARADAATDGPWDGDYGHFGTGIVAGHVRTGPNVIGSMWRPSDAEFVVNARADVPRLVAALRAVLDLHRPVEVEPSDTICGDCSFQLPNGRYFGKVEEWPCDTVRAVEAALGEVSP